MLTRYTAVLVVGLTCALPAHEETQPLGRGADSTARITFLYDAFGPASDLPKDWGFAALVEYGGRRVLFDTGNGARMFERNVTRLGVHQARLDAAVVSHRHGDHATGVAYLLKRNPGVTIYARAEGALFKSSAPRECFAHHPGLPPELPFADPPDRRVSGTPWPQARFDVVTATKEIPAGLLRAHHAVA